MLRRCRWKHRSEFEKLSSNGPRRGSNNRRRACNRSPEIGGESETTGGIPGHGPVAPQPVDASAEVSDSSRWCWICNGNCRAQLHHWSSLHVEAAPRSRHGGGGLGVACRMTGRHEHGAYGWESCGSSTHLWTDHRRHHKPPSDVSTTVDVSASRGLRLSGSPHRTFSQQ